MAPVLLLQVLLKERHLFLRCEFLLGRRFVPCGRRGPRGRRRVGRWLGMIPAGREWLGWVLGAYGALKLASMPPSVTNVCFACLWSQEPLGSGPRLELEPRIARPTIGSVIVH